MRKSIDLQTRLGSQIFARLLFVLLALGLMGTRRLSVALTALLCSVSLPGLLSVDRTLQISDALELLTLLLCAGLLLTPAQASLPQDTAS